MKIIKKQRKGARRVVTVALSAGMALMMPFTAQAAGWQKTGNNGWLYAEDDGSNLSGGFTPDGYYIDSSGIWYGTKTILETAVANRNSFLTAEAAGNFESFEPPLSSVQKVLSRDLGPIRSFSIYSDKIAAYSLNGSSYRELYALCKEPSTGGYVLELKTGLKKEQGNGIYTAWYDYQCLRLLLNLISPGGDILADAVYESWEGNNTYGLAMDQWVNVGGARIQYEARQDTGVYHFAPIS